MCGIYGLLQPQGQQVNPADIEKVKIALMHRGPDQNGEYTFNNGVFGNTRLSIVDIKEGKQPIFNEDKSLLVVFNGELFNYRALRNNLQIKKYRFRTNTDTEVILHAFEEYGPDCVHHFNGMFSFGIWNIRENKLFLARDRLGIKPLYYLKNEKLFSFSSEPKGLLQLLDRSPEIDLNSLNRFLTYGYFPGSDSIYKNIQKFPAGHYGWVKQGNLSLKKYYQPGTRKPFNGSLKDAINSLENLLDNSIKGELMGEVPIGLFLSGGLDSSSIAYFSKKHNSQLKSFSIKFPEKSHDESKEAKLIANHIGLEHHEICFSNETLRNSIDKVGQYLDEPFGDPTVFPLHELSEVSSQSVKVVLTGWGGDEIFAGYPTIQAHKYANYFRNIPLWMRNSVLKPLINRIPVSKKYMSFEFKAKRFIKGHDLSPQLQHFIWMNYFDEKEKEELLNPNIMKSIDQPTFPFFEFDIERKETNEILKSILQLDQSYFLEGNGLYQADRITMANSLEARVPLLNNDIIDFMESLPIKYKLHQGKLKFLLKQVMKDKLPPSIINKPKKGFGPPGSRWLRESIPDFLKQTLDSEKIEDIGIFNSKTIQKLIKQHLSMEADHGRKLWLILSFQLWYDHFIGSKKVYI